MYFKKNPNFLGKVKDNVAIWLDFAEYLGKAIENATKHHYLHGNSNYQDFLYMNVAKMNYTVGQFENKIDEFVSNLAMGALRMLNAMFG